MEQTAPERERLARDLAIEEGRRREKVDGQLTSHESRLNAINGSIKRTGEELGRVVDKLDEIAERHAQQEAVRAALEQQKAAADRRRTEALEKAQKQTEQAQASQISQRSLTIATMALMATIVLVGLAIVVFIVTRGHNA